jgi:hypothetical protein
MKRIVVLTIACGAVLSGAWIARSVVWGQAAEKSFTMTQSQWEELIKKRIADAQAKEGKEGPVTDQKILQPENWHKAIYNGVEYTIYTGPGQVLATRWAPPPQKAGAKLGAKPAESKTPGMDSKGPAGTEPKEPTGKLE